MGSFRYFVSQFSESTKFSTEGLFDDSYTHSSKSAIDDFVDKRTELFQLTLPYEKTITNLPGELTKMIFLGCISAIESYMRKIIRSIINVDFIANECCEERTLKYGAVIAHDNINMLPEALLENISFTSGKNISDAINDFLKVKCEHNRLLKSVLADYSKICELRHCVVHRFGLLGSSNAIRLGLSDHARFIEKPIKINFDKLNNIVHVCNNLVKSVNNHLFSEIIERAYLSNKEIWYSHYAKDRATFKKYMDIFADSTNPLEYKDVYRDFIKCMHEKHGSNYPTNK